MAVVLALQEVRNRIRQTFETDGADALFGWGERDDVVRQYTSRRVVFIPGDTSGAIGRFRQPKEVGKVPTRNLGDLEELCTVRLYAADSASSEDYEAQYNQARLLLEAFYRALRRAYRGNFSVVSARWESTVAERRYGMQCVLVIALSAPLTDSPLGASDYYALANPLGEVLGAAIDVQQLEVIETIDVEGSAS